FRSLPVTAWRRKEHCCFQCASVSRWRSARCLERWRGFCIHSRPTGLRPSGRDRRPHTSFRVSRAALNIAGTQIRRRRGTNCAALMGTRETRDRAAVANARSGDDEVSDVQTDFPPGKNEPASIADASPARSYAAHIVNNWRHAADGMMEVARLCCEASERLTASDKKQLIKRLPFKESTFSKFVQIGKDARLQRLHARRL